MPLVGRPMRGVLKHLAKGAKKKQLSKAKAVEPGQNLSAATPAALSKNLVNRDTPGKGVLGKDGLNKHTLSKNALSKHALGKDALGKDALGKDALGKNALNKNALGKNTLGKQTTLVERHRPDELILTGNIHDAGLRQRSFRLTAEVMGL